MSNPDTVTGPHGPALGDVRNSDLRNQDEESLRTAKEALYDAQAPEQKETNLKITVDTAPFDLFAKLVERLVDKQERSFELGDIPEELFRIETDDCATPAGELLVRFYPSDAFLRLAAALSAGEFDLVVVDI